MRLKDEQACRATHAEPRKPQMNKFLYLSLIVPLLVALSAAETIGAVVFPREFAPHEGLVTPPEQPLRAEICLNGFWQLPGPWGRMVATASS
jgi:hypothetical protein